MKFLSHERLKETEKAVLAALIEGWTLKSHRTLDGLKAYRLHALTGAVVDVADAVVDGLAAAKFLQSNQKFPAATYLLTDRGRTIANRLATPTSEPLTASRFANR